jgi:hypothetical protein
LCIFHLYSYHKDNPHLSDFINKKDMGCVIPQQINAVIIPHQTNAGLDFYLPLFNSFCQSSNAMQTKLKYYTYKQHLLIWETKWNYQTTNLDTNDSNRWLSHY